MNELRSRHCRAALLDPYKSDLPLGLVGIVGLSDDMLEFPNLEIMSAQPSMKDFCM